MAILGRINEIKKRFTQEDEVGISDYLDEELITFLDESTQADALTKLVDLLDQAKELKDREAFFHAILEREKIVSTGIGIGVAIPHAKLAGYEDFFIAIGIQKREGIPWHALDGLPVRIIFMIGGPDNRQTEYLDILSMITSAIKEEERRTMLLKAKTKEEVLAVFKGL